MALLFIFNLYLLSFNFHFLSFNQYVERSDDLSWTREHLDSKYLHGQKGPKMMKKAMLWYAMNSSTLYKLAMAMMYFVYGEFIAC